MDRLPDDWSFEELASMSDSELAAAIYDLIDYESGSARIDQLQAEAARRGLSPEVLEAAAPPFTYIVARS